MSNKITYKTIYDDIMKFKKSGGKYSSEFNITDNPSKKYFKIMFYFTNINNEGNISYKDSVGLLSPTWKLNIGENPQYHLYNSAWSYLKMNCEDERADMLKDFVTLLSNISAESPWYFSELSGLDAALERKQPMENDFKVEDQRKKITIKCLPDAYDDRIGTMLDLYRSIVWSWITKREIIPSNLRKFDMGIFVFNDPIIPFQTEDTAMYVNKDDNYESNIYKSSYKYIEFHNCEIDYNSGVSSYGNMNNKEGADVEYNIDILYDDCYENRYNEFLMRELGDIIKNDIIIDDYKTPNNTNPSMELSSKLNYYNDKPLSNLTSELMGTGKNIVEGVINRAVLGNIYTFSLTKLKDQTDAMLSGKVWSTARAVDEYITDHRQRKQSKEFYVNELGNIYRNKTLIDNI